MNYKKIYTFTKILLQCLLVFIEVGLIAFLFYFLTDRVVACLTLIDVVQRLFFGIALYEFIVFIILTQINDARKDAVLALKSAYNLALLYCDTNDSEIKNQLMSNIVQQLDNGLLNHTDIRKEYECLSKLLEIKNATAIKYRLIKIDHLYEYVSLQWRYTILLRLFK